MSERAEFPRVSVTGRFVRNDPPVQWLTPSTSEKVSTGINELVEREFAEVLERHGLTDWRKMPPGEERTAMKTRTFRVLYGGEP